MLNRILSTASNYILFLLFSRSWLNYSLNKRRIPKVQKQYLLNLIKQNSQTLFGRNHNFNKIKSIGDYQNQVPVTSYEYYLDYIDKIKMGELSVLSHDRITKFTISSGTSSASKYIPYNQSLIKEFDKCISTWLFDLYQHIPSLIGGKAFWIVTPSTKTDEEDGGIKKAFDNDSEYTSPLKQFFIRQIFVVPDEVAKYFDGENYFFLIGAFLLAEKNLRLISVWNPTVFSIILDKIITYKKQLIKCIEMGRIFLPQPTSNDNFRLRAIDNHFKRNQKRAEELNTLFNQNKSTPELWKSVWPNLKLISAWDSGWAEEPAKNTTSNFPGVVFQGKGLLATEGCITFPIFLKKNKFAYLPAYTSHFLEFEHLETKEIELLQELETNKSYEVLITTGGGLYRYRLNDIVTCYGHHKKLPLLRFDGKSSHISDLRGEKINEKHISRILKKVFNEQKIESDLHFIAPEIVGSEAHYVLFIFTKSSFVVEKLQQKVEEGLCENYHYKHCRNLNQLNKIEVFQLDDRAILRFYSILSEDNSFGASKQMHLRKETNWKSMLNKSCRNRLFR